MTRPGRYASALPLLLALLVLAAIWLPLFAHYYVPGGRPGSDVLSQLRRGPADPILRELEEMRIGGSTGLRSDRELLSAADALLAGELRLPGYSPMKIARPFAAEDLTRVPASLSFGSLVVPEILLDAYSLTGKEDYFAMAKDTVIGLAVHERAAWLDQGFLWNDHAIAARIPVLIKFWRIYRARADFDPQAGLDVLQLLARSGRLLAKRSHYTYRTNHGVMQNLGLLYLCIGFPDLPDARGWCELALDRLSKQIGFFVNTEGVVLEHSAGYHAFGTELLGMILRSLTLMERPLPGDWVEKYRKALDYYAALRRPDGTLPMYGDTASTAADPLVTVIDERSGAGPMKRAHDIRPAAAFSVFPVAGHALWWRGLQQWPNTGDLAQTVVNWSNFPDHGHKLADDLSVVLWSGGQAWITNVGYWPYHLPGRKQAETWNGSNAPHLSEDPQHSPRTTRLLSYGDNGRLTAVDVQRDGPAAYTARRQVVQLDSHLWLVLDHVQGEAAKTSTTTWTLYPSLSVAPGPFDHAFRIESAGKGPAMSAVFLGSAGLKLSTFRGSRQPFAGWVVIEDRPTPAPAFTTEQPAGNSWALALWMVESADGAGPVTAPPRMLEWASADRWKLQIPFKAGNILLQRIDGELLLQGAAAADMMRITLTKAPDVGAERAAISSAFAAAQAQSQKFRDVRHYRLKLTYLLLALLATQEVLRFLLRNTLGRYRTSIDVALSLCWLAGGAWIMLIYLPN